MAKAKSKTKKPKFTANEKRFYDALRTGGIAGDSPWSAKDALHAVMGERVMQQRDWNYHWDDYYDEETGEKSNLIILVDEDDNEIARDWEYTFSSLGQRGTAALLAYGSRGERSGNPPRKRSSKKRRGKRCPPGKIAIDRKGYKRKGSKGRKGAKVKRSTFCVKDRGRKGKTSFGAEGGTKRGTRPLISKKGKLGGPGYTRKPASERHRLLDRCAKQYGYRSCLGTLQALLLSTELSPGVKNVLDEDKTWLMKKHGKSARKGRRGNPETQVIECLCAMGFADEGYAMNTNTLAKKLARGEC